jgi:hypothetical protein
MAPGNYFPPPPQGFSFIALRAIGFCGGAALQREAK